MKDILIAIIGFVVTIAASCITAGCCLWRGEQARREQQERTFSNDLTQNPMQLATSSPQQLVPLEGQSTIFSPPDIQPTVLTTNTEASSTNQLTASTPQAATQPTLSQPEPSQQTACASSCIPSSTQHGPIIELVADSSVFERQLMRNDTETDLTECPKAAYSETTDIKVPGKNQSEKECKGMVHSKADSHKSAISGRSTHKPSKRSSKSPSKIASSGQKKHKAVKRHSSSPNK